MPRLMLTIGVTHYDDFNGAWQTLTGILANHAYGLDFCEFVIVDNNPGSQDSKALRSFVTRMMREWPSQSARYVPYDKAVGVAPVRNKLFSEAAGEFVLCLDSHIVFSNETLARLLSYLMSHSESSDLLTGPIVMDDGKTVNTDQLKQWTSAGLGVWHQDDRGIAPHQEQFEIDMQGLGVFCIRREAWPGFHEDLRGFGCVEPVLCEKVRRAGGKVLCLPFLRWHHRFGHYMKTASYPVSYYDKVRNYLIAFQEVDWNVQPLIDHFRWYLEEGEWKRLLIEFQHLDFEKSLK